MDAERCVMCGEIIPEGTQVCYNCMKSITKLNHEESLNPYPNRLPKEKRKSVIELLVTYLD